MSWDEYISQGISAIQRSDRAAAELAFKRALKHAKQNFKRTDSRLALTLSLLGHMYFHNVDFRQAELLLEQSLRLHSEADTLNEQCVLMDVFSLGEIKLALGKRVEACRLYESMIARLSQTEPADDSGVLAQAVQEFQHLLAHNKALLSYTERLELVQPELIQSILEAAEASSETEQRHDDAADDEHSAPEQPESVREREPENAVTTSGTHTISEVWKLQLTKGLTALKQDDDEKESWVAAYLNLESALRLARRMFAPGDPRLRQTLTALANASARLMMFEQAETLHREAIACAKQGQQDSASQVDMLRLGLGVFYAEFDHFAQAKKIFDQAKVPDDLGATEEGKELQQRIEKATERIAKYYACQNLLRQAQAAEEEQQFEKASKLLNTALSTLRQGFPPHHPEHARLLRYRSTLLRLLGQTEQSDESVQRAERIERANDTASSDWLKITQELPKPDPEQVPV
jgi:hypothetical protein